MGRPGDEAENEHKVSNQVNFPEFSDDTSGTAFFGISGKEDNLAK